MKCQTTYYHFWKAVLLLPHFSYVYHKQAIIVKIPKYKFVSRRYLGNGTIVGQHLAARDAIKWGKRRLRFLSHFNLPIPNYMPKRYLLL